MRYGIDEYSRYVERDDCGCACDDVDRCKITIEPYPFFYIWPVWDIPWSIWYKLTARVAILDWHRGMIRQHGVREWLRLRRF